MRAVSKYATVLFCCFSFFHEHASLARQNPSRSPGAGFALDTNPAAAAPRNASRPLKGELLSAED